MAPQGRFIRGILYFFTPIAGGIVLMKYTSNKAMENAKNIKSNQSNVQEMKQQNEQLKNMLSTVKANQTSKP